jgi:phage protein D
MPEAATTQAFYASRPKIKLDGQDVPEVSLGILSLSVYESTEGLYRAEITLGNWGAVDGTTDFLYFQRNPIDFGKEISISMGEGDTLKEVFCGRISAIEGRFPQQRPPEILILAEDLFQDLRMVRRTRVFEDTTVADVISEVADNHNLASEIDTDQTQFSVLAQVNQSDLAFIRQCAREVDAEIWIEDKTLKAKQRASRRHNEIVFKYGQRLFEFSVMADLSQQRTAVEVSGWDVQSKSVVKEKAENSVIQGELNDGSSGPQILGDKFGVRLERVVHQVPFSSAEANTMANSVFRQTARKFIKGQARMEGDGRIRVGSYVNLEGVGELFNGAYYVCHCKHSFNAVSGFQTHLQVERPGLGAA